MKRRSLTLNPALIAELERREFFITSSMTPDKSNQMLGRLVVASDCASVSVGQIVHRTDELPAELLPRAHPRPHPSPQSTIVPSSPLA